MTVPGVNRLRRAALEITAASRHPLSRTGIVQMMPSKLALTEEDASATTAHGVNCVAVRTHFAVQALVSAGLLQRPSKGVHEITPIGTSFLQNHTSLEITNADLKPYQEQQTSPHGADKGEADKGESDDGLSDQEKSPIERIDESVKEYETVVTAELLAAAKDGSPGRFEQLVVDLLEKMGYGEGDAIGGSGDGGIDGIINQDTLGLEKVYVQAKRYTSGSVGEPEIRNFAGSMIARGATKGVFITTGSFSSTARQTAANVSQRNETIRLVDGNELAQLMIRHGVGVVTEYTYEIKKLDENYFAEGI